MSRTERARLAKETINKVIPALLLSYPLARAGVNRTQLLHDIPPAPSSKPHKPIIRVIASDTLDAARAIHASHPSDRIAVLSMASPLRPGGGVLTGATSQEESLCIRSTLLLSLRDEYYRLPEDAVIFSPDILVFRAQDLEPLPKSGRFFVDVISCAALRFPEVEGGRYALEADREAMMIKMRLILRAAVSKGCTKLVLGAVGCGAYANPTAEVAELFMRVICGNPKRKIEETWNGIDEIVFAIKGGKDTLEIFSRVFVEVNGQQV
ncbi:hypothetical protein FIBSPDRAFT_908801 [Athelia psychrophila]|uniref:Microbial-type PARG catalytic domain-containing protein n=1 Tax=Athelia psychrophila TaxID=1759441 RepID=A0A166R6F5_9AGAM|nr:hypothetical protein FIBSPDRAFT_908801 [Fibularhizoctonia sp. CBS 109695]